MIQDKGIELRALRSYVFRLMYRGVLAAPSSAAMASARRSRQRHQWRKASRFQRGSFSFPGIPSIPTAICSPTRWIFEKLLASGEEMM